MIHTFCVDPCGFCSDLTPDTIYITTTGHDLRPQTFSGLCKPCNGGNPSFPDAPPRTIDHINGLNGFFDLARAAFDRIDTTITLQPLPAAVTCYWISERLARAAVYKDGSPTCDFTVQWYLDYYLSLFYDSSSYALQVLFVTEYAIPFGGIPSGARVYQFAPAHARRATDHNVCEITDPLTMTQIAYPFGWTQCNVGFPSPYLGIAGRSAIMSV